MTKASETPKVKHPHPLMQLGTPSIDIESDHIMQFMVFRMGGSAPVHVKNIPRDVTDPLYIKRQVGGGRYQIKAQAEGATSGKPHGCVLGATIYEWDGAPILDAPPVTPFSGQPSAQTIVEKASDHLPALITGVGGLLTAALGFISEQRNAREAAERARREYDDQRRRDEQAERDRRDAKERAEAEDRRAREQREAEERREERERREQARIAAEQKREDERMALMRQEGERRAAMEQMMLKTLLEGRAAGGLDSNMLLNHLLNRSAAPVQAAPSIDQILGAAQKLKEFGESGDKEMIGMIVSALAPTPVGQEIIARAGSLIGLYPKPEPQTVTPPPPAVGVEQLPPPVEAPPPPPPEPQVVAPGPVTIN